MDDEHVYSKPEALAALGSGASDFEGGLQPADARLLEAFPVPKAKTEGTHLLVRIGDRNDPQEFTSLCPKTGQPDFAQITVVYTPDEKCVESKSWKLYLGSFRELKEFHESCALRILDDLVALLDPVALSVYCDFTPRGGISFNPEAHYVRPMNMRLGGFLPEDALGTIQPTQ